MKSVAVLGLGVIALTTGAFITASAAAGTGTTISSLAKGSYFEARVGGAVRAMPAGAVAFGVVGDSAAGVAAFTITMTSEGSSGAILFTSLEGKVPAPGRYEIGGMGSSGFRASYVAGSEERPEGLFRGKHGVLEITSSGADHISGQFSFNAEGFMASDAADEDATVTVKGAFTSTRASAVVREVQP